MNTAPEGFQAQGPVGKQVAVLARGTLMGALGVFLFSAVALAGPPFRTDDPEPVEYRHWEVYLASQGSVDRDGTALTAPHVEINYGPVPNVQVHLIAPLEYVRPDGGPSRYGYGDTELGAKVRFLQESGWHPQVGVFPLVELPTGDRDRGLGSGEIQAFLPLWVQKSWGAWTTYGGGGYGINPGPGNRDYWFLGWEGQRDFTDFLTLGAEVFHQTPTDKGGESDTGFNLGAIINFSDLHHLLLSVGRDFSGPNRVSFYLGYQWTFGP